ncbi:glycosyltransferase family 2 protein [Gracilibacillus sp. D59]|uniref:glycosyltransferase family 2 protein n=1 Tax=Gracilibacillus sp. D59 TaxID=3457434 RepID=UPI003FCD32B3
MKEPLVSVVIPFYSGLKWLEEALESVNNQTYQNKEIIVINDGSPEDTEKVLAKFNNNIKEVKKINEGPAAARNYGILESKGKYIAFLDADDIWLPEKLELQVELMENQNYVWSQHSYEYFWNDHLRSKTMDTSIYNENVLKECYISFKIQTSCVMVKKDVLIKDKIFFPIHMRYGQDGAFYKQLAREHRLGYVNKILSRFRIRGNNAGFKAEIQLKNKAETWNNIKHDSYIKTQLPKLILLAYKFSCLGSTIFKKLKIDKLKTFKELISRILYFPSYILFKVYSKK